MKKIILLLTLLLIYNNSFAGNKEPFQYQFHEERNCIKLLSESIKDDPRFDDENIFKGKKGLERVLYDEENNSTLNLSEYSKFKKYREKNKKHNLRRTFYGFDKYDFLARRTNIATIITRNNFVVSNFLGFGKSSNFDFPLKAKRGYPFGDKYTIDGKHFKEYILYTHHSIKGDLLSCGIVKVKPLGKNTFNTIDESNYYTNILNGKNCNSGFEGENKTYGGDDFYKMKTDVCVQDYNKEDLLKLQVISIAYDNNSEYFNDYVAHKLQVKAMKNLDNQEKGLYGIRKIYDEYINEGTCFKLIHKSRWLLPRFCNGKFSDKYNTSNINISKLIGQKNIKNTPSHFSILKPFFNKVLAKREFKNTDELIEDSRGMVVYEDFPYELYKKIISIKNDSFKEYLLLAINPGFELYIDRKNKNNILLTPYEDVFNNCGLNLEERSKIVIDLLNSYKDLENIDFSKMSYSNKKFGDCIIPYPDKENIDKIIEGSFETNKLIAQKINGTYKSDEIDKNIVKLTQEENKLNLDYEKKLNELSEQFKSNKINQKEFNKLLKQEKETYEKGLKLIKDSFNEKIKEKEEIENEKSKEINKILNNDTIKKDNKNNNNLIIIILSIITGILIIFLSLKKKK